MQGAQTESTIIQALEHIYEYENFFDVVIIIRGGGSRSDLMSFDNYNLAYYITQFPIPIIAGIGHEKDTSIVDLVSHTSLKTPTAVAEFLIGELYEFEQNLDDSLSDLYSFVSDKLNNENEHLESLSNRLVPLLQNRLNNETKRLELAGQKIGLLSKGMINEGYQNLSYWQIELGAKSQANVRARNKDLARAIEKLQFRIKQQFNQQSKNLDYFESSLNHFDPKNVLKKGYSITKLNGKVLTDAKKVKEGSELETVLYKGVVKSKAMKKG
jgi:exodeoxyribonuclease VII large subunit